MCTKLHLKDFESTGMHRLTDNCNTKAIQKDNSIYVKTKQEELHQNTIKSSCSLFNATAVFIYREWAQKEQQKYALLNIMHIMCLYREIIILKHEYFSPSAGQHWHFESSIIKDRAVRKY